MADWEFYGRKEQLAALKQMLDRKRWFWQSDRGANLIEGARPDTRARVTIVDRPSLFHRRQRTAEG